VIRIQKNNKMNKEEKQRVCPVENAGGLDNSVRRLLQNPYKILKPFIHKGMTVLDLGCGPGFFSIEIAKMLEDSGKVIAADLQDGMLDKVISKIKGTELEQRIIIHKCGKQEIGLNEKVDFILAFYMVHEVPNQERLFEELKSLLDTNGKIYIIEPKFHVSKKQFEDMMGKIKELGFEILDRPKVFFSRTALITLAI
jgi:ubiquinone/menaquinone biosynthesis C-methylase UbiE